MYYIGSSVVGTTIQYIVTAAAVNRRYNVHARLSVPTIHFESTILYSIGNYNYYSILIDLVIVIIKTIIHYYYFTISALYSMFEYTIIISYYAPSSYARARSPPCSAWARHTHARAPADAMVVTASRRMRATDNTTEASQCTHCACVIITCRRTSAVFIINVVYYIRTHTTNAVRCVCSHTKREITSSDKTHVDPQGSRSGFTPYRLPPCKMREYPVAFKKFLSLSLSLLAIHIYIHITYNIGRYYVFIAAMRPSSVVLPMHKIIL